MKIIFALVVTLFIAHLTPVQAQINNSTIEDTQVLPVVTETVQATEPVAPIEQPVAVVEPVQVTRRGCELAYNYDWPQDIAYAICMAESTGNQDAVNWSDNHGKCVGSFSLWQVGCFWYPYYGYSSEDFYNPEVNVEIAYQIYKRQGSFKAWTTYTRGTYLKYL